VFQQRNSETFGDIPGVHYIADNMIIAVTTEDEHDKILQRAKEANAIYLLQLENDDPK